jgi:hypothetical protein
VPSRRVFLGLAVAALLVINATIIANVGGVASAASEVIAVHRVSVASDGTQANHDSRSPAVSSDGTIVAYYSFASNLVPGDTNGDADVFVYDRTTGTTTRISVASDGTQANNDTLRPAVSSDGTIIAYDSGASNLVPGDTNAGRDVFAVTDVNDIAPPEPGSGRFVDDDESVFEDDIEWIAARGITKGCNPPDNDRYCPDARVTRGQMAAFLVRALGYTDAGDGDLFIDDDESIFEADIDRLGTAGVTKGCNPPTNDRFCPTGNVTRGQMAAFLHRALG